MADGLHDLSLHDRKNRGRSAPPTRGGRGAGRGGGRASSVGRGGGRGGRGGRGTSEQAQKTQPAQTAPVENHATEENAVTNVKTVDEVPAVALPAKTAEPAAPAAVWSGWGSSVSFADMVKKQSTPQQMETVAPEPVEQQNVHADAAAQLVDEEADSSAKRPSTRGRGGRGGRNARGARGNCRPKNAQLQEELPLEDEVHEPVGVQHHARIALEQEPVPVYGVEEEVHDDGRKGYLNMGKWESAVEASPEGMHDSCFVIDKPFDKIQ